ncbi:M64 family metallopeptidase, partial [Alistipes ihumii]|uniref:M64 family metallopeptidase n=1 Tax=Alistipes ihumii TaxID=1470347 RepID=UPI003AF52B8E
MICIFGQWESLGRNADADLTDDPARIKWREFYELPRYGMVGAFEGAYMYARGIWRPETNSCMNNNVSYFNAPSRK